MDNWTFNYFRQKMERIENLLEELKTKETQMAQTLQDLQDAITAVDAKVDGISSQLTDLSADFDAAVAKLQADIAAGVDLTPAVTALAALQAKLQTVSTSLSDIDVKAETISGKPTP